MRAYHGGGVGAAWEREEAARRRAGHPVNGTFKFDLGPLTASERTQLAAHLADTASMARRGHDHGMGTVPSTGAIIDVLERIAAAAAAGTPGRTSPSRWNQLHPGGPDPGRPAGQQGTRWGRPRHR